ncbi:MAG: DNA adenine methylase [Nitrospinae bacterium]|nr:DNA adenine methylase [Nitrospinota bacterium]
MSQTTIPFKPILRYHGGKWRLAKWILPFFPPHRIYVEPFGGAASVLLRKPRTLGEVYNDLNGDMVNLFRVMQRRETAEELIHRIEWTLFSRQEFDDAYLPTDDPIDRALKTLVRAGMGYGSTGVTGQKTGFRGKIYTRKLSVESNDWPAIPSNLLAVHQRLRGVVIENRPALDLIRAHDGPETLFYCDPPYMASTRSAYYSKRGYSHEMTDEDHEALAAVLHEVDGAVVLSGYPSPLYDRLYADWRRVETSARADKNRQRTEVLWIKYS